ncbi:MAG: molybdopterin molybdotransferase MoeA [Nitrososphaerales archaeon]
MTSEDHVHYHGVDKAEEHVSVNEALEIFLSSIRPIGEELVSSSQCTGRILYENIVSSLDIPPRARSTRDGYALNISRELARGTRLRIVGEVRIGREPQVKINEGEAILVATGSFLPKNANSVVMKEYVTKKGKMVALTNGVRAHENILERGEDIKRGEVILLKGTRLEPHHVGLLALTGTNKVKVFQKPRIAFFSTGDELVNASRKSKNKINDVTRPFIKSALLEMGVVPVDLGIARDNLQAIKKKMIKGLSYDALILSAGSSVGERDYVSRAAKSIGGMKILVHGVAMRPSSPTGLGVYKGKPFIMLPGFPTSAIVSFFVFARPAVLKLQNASSLFPPKVKAILEQNYEGRRGVTHFVRVLVKEKAGEYYAEIVKPAEAQFSSWLKLANGIGMIDSTKLLLKAEDRIDVFLIGNIISS